MRFQRRRINPCALLALLLGFSIVSQALTQTQNKSDSFPPTQRKELGTHWKVKGKVTSTNMRPLSGVKVYVTNGVFYHPMGSIDRSPFTKPVKSDFGGNFEIDVSEGLLILLVTPGFAPLAVPAPDGSAMEVQMETGRTISGRITSPDGTPMPNSIVTPVRWKVSQPSESDPRQVRNFNAGLPEHGKDWATMTDADGKFQLSNLPSDYRIGLSIKTEGWREDIVFVRPADDIEAPDHAWQILVEDNFEHPVEPCSMLKITAVDEDGSPARIAKVSFHGNASESKITERFRSETFDASSAIISQPANREGTVAYLPAIWKKRTGNQVNNFIGHIETALKKDQTAKTNRFRYSKDRLRQVLQAYEPIRSAFQVEIGEN